MTVKKELEEDGCKKGEVWFSFEDLNEDEPKGMVIVYGIPEIMGKGGACVNDEGEYSYKKENVLNQEVNVCEVYGYRLEYLLHPTKNIEYLIDTSRLNYQETQMFKNAILNSFRFE